jgi:hypothetical protein
LVKGFAGHRMKPLDTIVRCLMPFLSDRSGEDGPGIEDRLDALRQAVPGRLPDGYATALLWLRQGVLLEQNKIISVEPPLPPEPGILNHVEENPPISVLLGLATGHNNVLEEYEATSYRMPPGLVPIGFNFGGDYMCLDTSEAGNGLIYHWFGAGDPGPDDKQGRPGWGNTFLLAYSFTDFCQRLRPADPIVLPDLPPGSVTYVCNSRR